MSEISAAPDNRLTADSYEEVLEAVERLYIPSNMSARIRFLQERPVIARYIFGVELIAFDTDGTDDLERKAQLEAEAEERRFAFEQALSGIENNSVQEGVLNIEYVRSLVTLWGREVSVLVYAPRIVNRILGGGAADSVEVVRVDPPASVGADDGEYAPNMKAAPKRDVPLPTPADMKFSEKLIGPKISDMPDVKPIETNVPKTDEG